MHIDPHGVEVDDCICHRREVRGLGDEELLPVAAEPKDLALHRHEHALVFWIEWPIGLVGEERIESPSGVLGQVQGDRARQAGVDEGSTPPLIRLRLLPPRASGLIVPDPGVLCRIASQVPAAQLQGRRRRPERELGISGFSA